MSIYQQYIECIKTNLGLNEKFFFFKSDPRYRFVLEHVDEKQGYLYLSEIAKNFPHLYLQEKQYLTKLCEMNDSCGYPIKYSFKGFTLCSPTNLRYLYHAMLILNYARQKDLNNIDFIEIGGGYGGLCFFIYRLSHLFEININSYSVYDLPEACLLQERYLKPHDINIKTYQLDQSHNLKKDSFLVSNYSFSELPKDIREKYSEQVINPFTSHGFLAWNACHLYDFTENKITSESEHPLTGPNNLYVYF